MKHQYTRIAAFAMVAAGVWVALFKAGPDDSRSSEITEALKQRQSKRFEETRAERLASRQSGERELQLQQLKEQLLEEFPNLRGDPPIPNEENPMYLLNELVQELLGKDDGNGFDDELLAIMGKDASWDLKAAQDFLKRYDWVFEKLDQIAVLSPSSVYYQHQQEKTERWRPDAPMLLMDLIRLKTRVALDEGDEGTMAESQRMREFFAASMLRAEGSSYLNHLMMDCVRKTPIHAPMDEKAYQQFSPLGLYGGAIMGWLLPNWGKNLNPETLGREIRRTWWDEIYRDPFVHETSPDDEPSIRAYAHYVSDSLTRLEQQDIRTFVSSGFASIETGGLSEEQLALAGQVRDRFNAQITGIFETARFQALQTVATQLKESVEAGDYHAGYLPAHSTFPLLSFPVDPLTGDAYSFDPDTRILTLETQLKGYEFQPVRLTQQGGKSPFSFEGVTEEKKQE